MSNEAYTCTALQHTCALGVVCVHEVVGHALVFRIVCTRETVHVKGEADWDDRRAAGVRVYTRRRLRYF